MKDIKAKRELVKDNGGFIAIEPLEIRDGERICPFSEPSGVTFAMIRRRARSGEPLRRRAWSK